MLKLLDVVCDVLPFHQESVPVFCVQTWHGSTLGMKTQSKKDPWVTWVPVSTHDFEDSLPKTSKHYKHVFEIPNFESPPSLSR